MPTPLVAVPTYHLAQGRIRGWEKGGYGVPDRYVRALRRAGVRPMLVTAPDPAPADEILALFDALLLLGGGDIEPRRYGAVPSPTIYGIEPDRDDLELALVEQALATGLPVFAVCRGFQILNVALGGSTLHDVAVAPGTRLAKACDGAGRIHRCTSHHHQGIDRLADGLTAVAWSDDGLVEAVEGDGESWVLGVQWHPEMTAEDDPVQQGLFDAFAAEIQHS